MTDPAYVRNPSEYQVNIKDRENDTESRLSVRVQVSESLFNQIGSLKSHLVPSHEYDESFYQFGLAKDSLKDYKFLGWHGSDSGMTCIVLEDPFIDEETIQPVDSTEFTLATIQDSEMECNQEEFPLYKWFGRIPEGASSVRVYGCERDYEGSFNGLLIRSGEDNLIDNEDE